MDLLLTLRYGHELGATPTTRERLAVSAAVVSAMTTRGAGRLSHVRTDHARWLFAHTVDQF
jgi:hypothetical protein